VLPLGPRRFFNKFLPLVSQQIQREEDLAPSLLERNSCAVAVELEREADWGAADLDPVVRVMVVLWALPLSSTHL